MPSYQDGCLSGRYALIKTQVTEVSESMCKKYWQDQEPNIYYTIGIFMYRNIYSCIFQCMTCHGGYVTLTQYKRTKLMSHNGTNYYFLELIEIQLSFAVC